MDEAAFEGQLDAGLLSWSGGISAKNVRTISNAS